VAVRAWKHRFLLDVWAEPREIPHLPAIVRARVRDMGDDTETYVGSLAEIEQLVETRLDEAGIEPRVWEREQ